MILDDDAPMSDSDFEDALATARDGFAVDWPLPDPVLTALADVVQDPSDVNIDTARTAWRTHRPSD